MTAQRSLARHASASPREETKATSESSLLDTDVAIETPEHIVFRHRVAGPARRVLAYVVDLIICYGVVFAIAIATTLALLGAAAFDAAEAAAGAQQGLLLLLLFAAQWIYFVAWETWRGTTPGKRALGLRVVTVSGRAIGFSEAALRNVLRAADVLPFAYAVGLTSMALTSRFQRIGDLVAGTIVIIPDHARVASPIALVPPAYPEELASIPEDVSLDADERAALELFLRRCGTLGPARAHELASILIGPFIARFRLHVRDPVRMLALLYDRSVNAGRHEGPASSRRWNGSMPPSNPPPRIAS